MAVIKSFEVLAVDLPFRQAFKHAAAERNDSCSLFVKCTTDTGATGFGETLPRDYVTGESRASAFVMLRDIFLPRLLGQRFSHIEDVEAYLRKCDGQSPGWICPETPQSAAWCAVDLALLDTFGRALGRRVPSFAAERLPESLRYSGVLSADKGVRLLKSALKQWLYGIRQVKLKVDDVRDAEAVRLLRRVFGSSLDIRVDANMAWTATQAIDVMLAISRHGVRSFEQPVAADDLEGMGSIVSRTGLEVMADESLDTAASLSRLIEARACTAVNVRISKCGGLMAACNRARAALAAGLSVQLGCQVGESSLLSAAHLRLAHAVHPITYAEGCFGRFLLREDPASPVLQFGYGGRPPRPPQGPGLGITIDATVLRRWATETAMIQ
jgi:L-Ala-D/L-Glu epimerase